jgi:hypothetical protein
LIETGEPEVEIDQFFQKVLLIFWFARFYQIQGILVVFFGFGEFIYNYANHAKIRKNFEL